MKIANKSTDELIIKSEATKPFINVLQKPPGETNSSK